ncbi:MAG: STAS domain-containing protein [Acidobacteriota bacterium]|nr:STAS domain-containing protein [Acidobacteriota bacterium]MDE2711138.1 STAS domain-containing protein [Acidobacteriota bacterium]MXW71316.1 STAS domain-containing protein [Acidobacteriota bacterium]MXX85577.1 STAS domain-containing protein [Acidobacteriota bacterium]MYE45050.1 STAS domain-containing protein [Acidobacteriota bacterium]
MQLDLKERAGVSLLQLNGRLVDGHGDQELREAVDVLLDSGRTRIVVDLSGVSAIDSAGLGELVACARRVARAGGALKALHPRERVVHVMNIARVLPLFEVFETEDQAVASFTTDA